jgi:Domain of unknown function (DUF1707)
LRAVSDRVAIRASDAEREHAAATLREHFAEGRLNEDELSERLDAVYQAKTVHELDELGTDLPELPLSHVARRAELEVRKAELRRHLFQRAGGSLSPFAICTLVWVATGAEGEFWPVWVLIFPLVFLLRNAWRLYGPAPELDRVQRELERRSRRRARHGHRARGDGPRELS